ncbi:uncharacterized protein ACLA_086860 [Aspergillus clavatus NRRL 1]|uniref:Uncharacterized protein n=1 Tax=Aspergillus clavatus (strain ATCC 1007 / CBS 513.65 / DSM 816 / NCTC 3887 / NRRL 1 / QM 1276 / 107) TaxID=344612 RepID=A1CUJ7_ASPCL|nr:uncharacterized protein ACLA_086860 [Aspergillus clavatus NRRL 1]EAW06984.1 conserved hypothetical protein [Aspergillus clavatus NRRL 1]
MSSPPEESESSSSSSPSYPDPDLRYPKFKLSDLPDAPPHWRLFGETADDVLRTRKFVREQLVAMIDFYAWGIDMGFETRMTNLRLTKAIWKLFYYFADQHLPTSVRDLLNFDKKDGGPRLLSREITDSSLLPISRYYPDPPSLTAQAKPDFVRPQNAAEWMPDAYVEQMCMSSRNLNPSMARAPSQTPTATLAPSSRSGSRNGINSDNSDDTNGNLQAALVGPVVAGFSNPLTLVQSANPTGAFIPAPAPATSLRVPAHKARAVIEAVEKSVMNFAYQELERDPSAVPQDPRPFQTVLRAEDVSKALIGSFSANAQVRLSPDPLDPDRSIIDPNGSDYPCRGRGPVWRDNSGSIDSLIVVGKLLNAGSTIIDRKRPGVTSRFTEVERAFVEATDINWDTLSREESMTARDHLWHFLDGRVEGVQVKILSPLWNVWSECAGRFDQFHFTYREAVSSCQCTGEAATIRARTQHFVIPDYLPGDENGVNMSDVVSRPFAPFLQADCVTCQAKQSVTVERRFDTLPLRMVVGLNERTSAKNHTKDITFDFCDGDGIQQRATYRWLGGIYYKDYQFRVFWTDTKRGETENGFLQTYDSTMNEGLIVGDIPPAHKDERVPAAWWKNTHLPFLIYERVVNPEPEVMSLAWHALSDMMKVQMDGNLIMQQHTPWTRNEPTTSPPKLPWDRCIPEVPRFRTGATGYSSEVTLPDDIVDPDAVVVAPKQGSTSYSARITSPGTSVSSGQPQSASMHISPAPTGLQQAAQMQAPTNYVAATAVNGPPFASTFATAQATGVEALEFSAPNAGSLFNTFNGGPAMGRSGSSRSGNSFSRFNNYATSGMGDGNAMQISPTQQFFWIPSPSMSPERQRTSPRRQQGRQSRSPDMMAGFAVRGGGDGRTSPWLQFVRLSPQHAVEEVQDNNNNANTSAAANANGNANANANKEPSNGRKAPRKRARAEPTAPVRRSTRRRA